MRTRPAGVLPAGLSQPYGKPKPTEGPSQARPDG